MTKTSYPPKWSALEELVNDDVKCCPGENLGNIKLFISDGGNPWQPLMSKDAYTS